MTVLLIILATIAVFWTGVAVVFTLGHLSAKRAERRVEAAFRAHRQARG